MRRHVHREGECLRTHASGWSQMVDVGGDARLEFRNHGEINLWTPDAI
jgi:hypothetical protein